MHLLLSIYLKSRNLSYVSLFAFPRNVVKKQKPMTKRRRQWMYRVQPGKVERQVDFSVFCQPGYRAPAVFSFLGVHHRSKKAERNEEGRAAPPGVCTPAGQRRKHRGAAFSEHTQPQQATLRTKKMLSMVAY